MDKALHRVADSSPDDQFAPLAETLLWVVMINDAFWEENQAAYEAGRSDNSNGRSIEGLRYARHRLVHDIRVYGMHGVIYGGAFSSGFSSAFHVHSPKWTWRGVSDLSEAANRDGEDTYKELLEGREVEPTLQAVNYFLGSYYALRDS